MLSRGVGLTSLQRVNLYPTVTPDPVTKVWGRRRTQVRGGVGGEKTGQTAIYATKETIYLGLRIASTN